TPSRRTAWSGSGATPRWDSRSPPAAGTPRCWPILAWWTTPADATCSTTATASAPAASASRCSRHEALPRLRGRVRGAGLVLRALRLAAAGRAGPAAVRARAGPRRRLRRRVLLERAGGRRAAALLVPLAAPAHPGRAAPLPAGRAAARRRLRQRL